ncbi:MAG: hypothetical protein ACP6KW_09680 [Candidatus Thorarchaeota archaeon]
MMLVQEHIVSDDGYCPEIVSPAWLAGAKAGLAQCLSRRHTSEWNEFIDSLLCLLEAMRDLSPVEPGAAPDDGSMYEALGGYVSVAGRVSGRGLAFGVPLIHQQNVASLFPGMALTSTGPEIMVDFEDLCSFMNLVPIRGPIEREAEVLYE